MAQYRSTPRDSRLRHGVVTPTRRLPRPAEPTAFRFRRPQLGGSRSFFGVLIAVVGEPLSARAPECAASPISSRWPRPGRGRTGHRSPYARAPRRPNPSPARRAAWPARQVAPAGRPSARSWQDRPRHQTRGRDHRRARHHHRRRDPRRHLSRNARLNRRCNTKQVDTALARGQQAPAPRLAFSRSRPCPGLSLWM